MTTVSVRVHWFFAALLFVEMVYRAYYGAAVFTAYALLWLLLVVFNGYTQYRLRSDRAFTWRWILGCASYVFASCPAPCFRPILGAGLSLSHLSEFWGPPQLTSAPH